MEDAVEITPAGARRLTRSSQGPAVIGSPCRSTGSVNHVSLSGMKTLSVRDLRQRWPEAEALLRIEREIIITRDSRPVAKLVRFTVERRPRKRFDPVAHSRWQWKVSGGRASQWVDRALAESREDRPRRSDRA